MVNRPNGIYYLRIDSALDHKDIQFVQDPIPEAIKKIKNLMLNQATFVVFHL